MPNLHYLCVSHSLATPKIFRHLIQLGYSTFAIDVSIDLNLFSEAFCSSLSETHKQQARKLGLAQQRFGNSITLFTNNKLLCENDENRQKLNQACLQINGQPIKTLRRLTVRMEDQPMSVLFAFLEKFESTLTSFDFVALKLSDSAAMHLVNDPKLLSCSLPLSENSSSPAFLSFFQKYIHLFTFDLSIKFNAAFFHAFFSRLNARRHFMEIDLRDLIVNPKDFNAIQTLRHIFSQSAFCADFLLVSCRVGDDGITKNPNDNSFNLTNEPDEILRTRNPLAIKAILRSAGLLESVSSSVAAPTGSSDSDWSSSNSCIATKVLQSNPQAFIRTLPSLKYSSRVAQAIFQLQTNRRTVSVSSVGSETGKIVKRSGRGGVGSAIIRSVRVRPKSQSTTQNLQQLQQRETRQEQEKRKNVDCNAPANTASSLSSRLPSPPLESDMLSKYLCI